ncbi:MAG: PH domain-containing protein, partial [Candidatus Levyibacteriota bacterium]
YARDVMQNTKKISTHAFAYRFFIEEALGFFLFVIITITFGFGMTYVKGLPFIALIPTVLFLLFLVQLVVIFLLAWVAYSNVQYAIVQNSLTLTKGLFSIQTETIPFQKIKNASFQQSLLQRFFSVGNIIIDQETEKFIWESVDTKTATIIMTAVSERSNVQPIAVASPPNTPVPPVAI